MSEGESTGPGRVALTSVQMAQILAAVDVRARAALEGGSPLTLEDAVGVAARTLAPILLVDLPLEFERCLDPASSGEPPQDHAGQGRRIEMLRLIIARLGTEWGALSEELVRRMGEIAAATVDPPALARLRGRLADDFSTVAPAKSTAPAASEPRPAAPETSLLENLVERVADAVAGKAAPAQVAENVIQDLAHTVTENVVAGVAAAVPRAELSREDVARAVDEAVARLAEGPLADLRREIAALDKMAFPISAESVAHLADAIGARVAASAELSDADVSRVARTTSDALESGALGVLLREVRSMVKEAFPIAASSVDDLADQVARRVVSALPPDSERLAGLRVEVRSALEELLRAHVQLGEARQIMARLFSALAGAAAKRGRLAQSLRRAREAAREAKARKKIRPKKRRR